eukprot:s2202_g3.t1
MRGNSRIQLKNGRLIDMITGGHRNLHAIYGGVEFGLDRFELAQRHAMQGQAGMQLGQSGRPMFMPQRFQIGQQAQVPQMPQGVDLNLDKFNLSRIEKFAGYLPAAAGTNDSLEAKVTLGKAFLKGLRERTLGKNMRDWKYPGLKAEYEDLLLKVYESPECDRREEGDAFVPPDPSMEYTSKIRSLVNEEKLLFERRQMHFFDKAFQVGNAGPEFPRSWTSRIQDVSNKKMGLMKVDFDDTFAMVLAHDILPTAAPEFKKQTEDGSTFRIYQIGSLEVRTTQLKFGQEKVGAIFSSRAPEWQLKCNASNAAQEEKLQECKVFIEPADGHLQSGKQPHHFYLVFKTVQENVIVVEQLSNGSRALAVNPRNLEDRNSLAKQLFTAECSATATIGALSGIQAQGGNMPVSLSVRKQFAKMVFQQMTGQSFRGRWGGSVRRVGQSLKPAMSVGAPDLGMLDRSRSRRGEPRHAAVMALLWEVVGGAEHGGIIVRSGCELTSEMAESRLSTGSVVKELNSRDGRIEYELVQGSGPASGWVTPSLRGKELLVKKAEVSTQEQVTKRSGRSAFSQWVSSKDEAELPAEQTEEVEQKSDLQVEEAPAAEEAPVAGKDLSSDEADALKVYLERFGESRDGCNPGYNRKAFPWYTGPAKQPERQTLSNEALKSAMNKPVRRVMKDKHWEVDSEGEDVPLCTRCSLPVGEFSYQGREGKETCVHAECMAQVLIQDRQRDENSRAKRENLKKQKNRKEYDIGWRMDSVPKNSTLAVQMGCPAPPQGLCCLVLDETSRTVKVAATLEPSAAINLEYLLLALKVRRTAQREPLFSLDPVDPQNLEKTPQKKVYEPSWLAGTSVGDVMFQADYFLKETSYTSY